MGKSLIPFIEKLLIKIIFGRCNTAMTEMPWKITTSVLNLVHDAHTLHSSHLLVGLRISQRVFSISGPNHLDSKQTDLNNRIIITISTKWLAAKPWAIARCAKFNKQWTDKNTIVKNLTITMSIQPLKRMNQDSRTITNRGQNMSANYNKCH